MTDTAKSCTIHVTFYRNYIMTSIIFFFLNVLTYYGELSDSELLNLTQLTDDSVVNIIDKHDHDNRIRVNLAAILDFVIREL